MIIYGASCIEMYFQWLVMIVLQFNVLSWRLDTADPSGSLVKETPRLIGLLSSEGSSLEIHSPDKHPFSPLTVLPGEQPVCKVQLFWGMCLLLRGAQFMLPRVPWHVFDNTTCKIQQQSAVFRSLVLPNHSDGVGHLVCWSKLKTHLQSVLMFKL